MARQTESLLHRLFKRHHEKMIRTAYRMVGDLESAQDLVQETFLLALARRDDFINHPVPEGWLMTALYNLARNERKRQANHQTISIDEIMEPAAPDAPLPLDFILPAELSPEDRKILIWRFEQQLEYKEIADRLGISVSSCRSRVSRALAKCRKYTKKS